MEDEAEFSVRSHDYRSIQNPFKRLVAKSSLPKRRWADPAAEMVRDFVEQGMLDPDLISWIIRKWRKVSALPSPKPNAEPNVYIELVAS